ncbi:Glycosyl transferase family group 2 [Amycolatopsis sacchari]|uniref:Glycosyl transferase family group 2 n=2 Tax=Amycolatopsis sacchari TaxID=115433 RepID=A0A1I4DB68_9PSEU|nr:glycosyltransferase family 2 protein [Amycolatopsis sacchari]SFK90355.1 Glycosyl transferase family group 2 [Amycolatopsis sacchari]
MTSTLVPRGSRAEVLVREAALPEFDDPEVVAVAGCAVTDWRSSRRGATGFVLTAHRSRTYALLQRLLKFGQTWHRTNATHIVPGFASLYRGRVLPSIDINPPGLVIEDFNMTFEVYRRRLGKVGFSLGARAVTQDPDTWRDYVRQVRRWALGFWQTVRRFRPRWDLFTAMLAAYVGELVLAGVLLVSLPLLVLVLVLPVPVLHDLVAGYFSLGTVGLGVVLPDVLLTVLVAAVERRPRYLLAAPFFLPLRIVDAAIALAAIPLAWRARSTGRWKSPVRRGAESAA